MNKQMTFPQIPITEPDLKSPIPRSWNITTARCGLRPEQMKKCRYHNLTECPYMCQKG